MNDRHVQSAAFLARAGWAKALRTTLAGDASERRYERLFRDGKTAVLMDAPPGIGDDTATFARVARHLAAMNLSPPAILAEDHATGFLLLEDLGDGLFSRLVAEDAGMERPIYAAATDVLLHLQARPAMPGLPNASAGDWAEAASFAVSWYSFAATGISHERALFVTVLEDLIRQLADGPRVMILRDYHAENLLWLPERNGVSRVGLLDFQLAQMGQAGYDLVSLLQDARRDVALETEAEMITRFCAAKGIAPSDFAPTYAVLGAQRGLRILGVFARLCLKAGKAGYVGLIPRVWAQLERNLAHPELAPLAAICRDLLPAPSSGVLERIHAQCGKHPLR